MKSIRYILFAFVVYVVFLFMTFPANTVYAYWKETMGEEVPFSASQLDGSIWSGKATEVRVGSKQVKSVSWQFHPFKLFLGRVELGWEFEVDDGYGKGVIGRRLMGSLYLNDVEAWVPMSEISQMANLQVLRPAGSLSVNMQQISLNQQSLTAAIGNIEWNSAELTLLSAISLGDLQIRFEPADDGVKGVLSDQGGPLQADGLLTLSNDGKYTFTGVFAARDPQQTDLKNALQSLGRAGADGKHKITRSGELSQLGLF